MNGTPPMRVRSWRKRLKPYSPPHGDVKGRGRPSESTQAIEIGVDGLDAVPRGEARAMSSLG
jgi:hypothetical protein